MATTGAIRSQNPRPSHSTSNDPLKHFQTALSRLSPLVTLDSIKAHLLLIGAFREVLEKVESFTGDDEPTDTLRSYLCRGVHRLHIWLTCVIGPSTDRCSVKPQELPPLDVLLLFHAYMLRPHRFYEASVTTYPQLFSMGAFPLLEVALLIDPDTFEYTPTQEQKLHWEKRTGIAFDPTIYKKEAADVEITCPRCRANFQVPWEKEGLGYGERMFSHTCSSCHLTVTHDRLCVAIFMQEVRAIIESEDSIISGTLLDNRGNLALHRARLIALEVVKALRTSDGAIPDGSIPNAVDITMKDIANRLHDAKGKLRHDRILFLLRPFTQPSPFRQDLARAVFLQRRMNSDLWVDGMCSRRYLSGPCEELRVGCSRYKVFLEMAAFPEKGRIVPTPDVDLIWHTHQLNGPGYKDSVFALFGMYLDHMSMEEDTNGHQAAVENSAARLKEVFAQRFSMPAPLMTKKCDHCNNKGCSICGCGPSMTQDFLIDDLMESDSEQPL